VAQVRSARRGRSNGGSSCCLKAPIDIMDGGWTGTSCLRDERQSCNVIISFARRFGGATSVIDACGYRDGQRFSPLVRRIQIHKLLWIGRIRSKVAALDRSRRCRVSRNGRWGKIETAIAGRVPGPERCCPASRQAGWPSSLRVNHRFWTRPRSHAHRARKQL